jgi:hypothetical protein
MAIPTDKNTLYGGTLVNQKYKPLHNVGYQNADRPIYTGLLTNRAKMLRSSGLLGKGLRLAMPSWQAAIHAEAGNLPPPLVVVSSNRATWIKAGIDAGNSQREALEPPLADASDLRALTALAGQTVSPPLYAPWRAGANRNVYVVVHMDEYTLYKETLSGTGITPVGWRFVEGVSPQSVRLVGFGAARFAAMEFCKWLRRQAKAPWSLAWLIDDNVVALGKFPGFTVTEAAVGANVVCAGFQGATEAQPRAAIGAWAWQEVNAGRNVTPPALPASQRQGIVQQAALWNVAYLDAQHLNFGPAFIASAEDLSLASYFDKEKIAYLFYKGVKVYKECPAADDQAGAQIVNDARRALAAWVAAEEAADPADEAPPPPPVEVEPADRKDGDVQKLATFIVERVLPNSPMKDQSGDLVVQSTAKCRAVEQLVSGAIGEGYADPAAMQGTFQINGASTQVVEQVNAP